MNVASTHVQETLGHSEDKVAQPFLHVLSLPFSSVEALVEDADELDKATRGGVSTMVEQDVEHPVLGDARRYQLALSIPGATTDLADEVFLYRRASEVVGGRKRRRLANEDVPTLVLQNYTGESNHMENKWRLTLVKDGTAQFESNDVELAQEKLDALLYGIETTVARTIYGKAFELAVDRPLKPMNHIGQIAIADEVRSIKNLQ